MRRHCVIKVLINSTVQRNSDPSYNRQSALGTTTRRDREHNLTFFLFQEGETSTSQKSRKRHKDSGFSDLSSFGCVLFPFDLHHRTWVEFDETGSIESTCARGENCRHHSSVRDYITVQPVLVKWSGASASASPFCGTATRPRLGRQLRSVECVVCGESCFW